MLLDELRALLLCEHKICTQQTRTVRESEVKEITLSDSTIHPLPCHDFTRFDRAILMGVLSSARVRVCCPWLACCLLRMCDNDFFHVIGFANISIHVSKHVM